jgi:hypothetical protein
MFIYSEIIMRVDPIKWKEEEVLAQVGPPIKSSLHVKWGLFLFSTLIQTSYQYSISFVEFHQ